MNEVLSYKISVIIPVYNVDKYLSECLDSVLAQDYDNYEVIIVNDGSTDNSLNIAESYISAFKGKLKIVSQNNSGLSSARNKGLQEACGEYIYFLDSDDTINTKTFSLCSQLFIDNNVDVIFFNATAFVDGLDESILSEFCYERNVDEGIYECNELFEIFLNKKYIVSACCYIIKATSYSELKFPLGLLHEDNYYTTKVLCKKNKKAYVISKKLFNRRIRPNSIMSTKKNINHVDGYFKVAEMLYDEHPNNNNVKWFSHYLCNEGFKIFKNNKIKAPLAYKINVLSILYKLNVRWKLRLKLFIQTIY